ncbi:MAG: accessory gene regulator B family protein [Lachnospiraceae bacterium]|nr:accessory gene regulator B family protein [Lachnospiraceae bacterium]
MDSKDFERSVEIIIEKMAAGIVSQMTHENIIDEAKADEYIYILTILAEKFIAVGSIILISLIVGNFVPAMLFLAFILSLRKFTGGFHLPSFGLCYMGTLALYIIASGISLIMVDYLNLLLMILAISVGIIGMIGTINHPNVKMNEAEFKASKKWARIVLFIQSLIIAVFVILDIHHLYICYMSVAIVSCAVLLCVAKIIKQEVSVNEEIG